MSESAANRPATLLVAAVVLAAEGLTALALGGYVGVETALGAAHDVMSSVVVAAFGICVGLGLGWVAWGLRGAQRWSRGPAVVTQIFALPLAVTLIQSAQYAWGVPLVAAAAIALVTLLAPQSTKALMGD